MYVIIWNLIHISFLRFIFDLVLVSNLNIYVYINNKSIIINLVAYARYYFIKYKHPP
jgi:hypothetical protein